MLAVYLCAVIAPISELDLAAYLRGQTDAPQRERIAKAPRLRLGEAQPTGTSLTSVRLATPVRAAIGALGQGPRVIGTDLMAEVLDALSQHNVTELEAIVDLDEARRWLMEHRGRICFTALDRT
jgi:hypothetical protein